MSALINDLDLDLDLEFSPADSANEDVEGSKTPWPMPDELGPIAALGNEISAIMDAGNIEIPVFPILATRILSIMNDSEPDVLELARVVMCEPAVAFEILRVSNSLAYSRGQPVTSIKDAVIRLGAAEASKVAIASATRDLFSTGQGPLDKRFERHIHALWHHAVVCSFSCGAVSSMLNLEHPERAFLSGLLHDVGQGAVLRCVQAAAEITGIELTDRLVVFVLDDVHSKEGKKLAVQQEVPDFVSEVCGHHHDGSLPATQDHSLVYMVRLVSGLDDIRIQNLVRPNLNKELEKSAAVLKLNDQYLHRILKTVAAMAEKATQMIT